MTEEDQAQPSSADAETTSKDQYPVCSKCCRNDVVMDAWAKWDPETRRWELSQVFDNSFCLNCEEETALDWISTTETRQAKILRLNDNLRAGKTTNGKILVTSGIRSLGAAFEAEVMQAVSSFDAFTGDNDPHSEHDFGALEVQGEKVFFKIDYYDLDLNMHSPDPSDPAVTKRVLTIMLASEY